VGEVLPSLAEVQVTAIKEHLHLPPSQALLVVETMLEFSATSDGPSHAVGSFCMHNDQPSQIEGQVHSQRQTSADQI